MRLAAVSVLLLAAPLWAQPAADSSSARPGPRAFSFGTTNQVVRYFDSDGDGRLDRSERLVARKALSEGAFARGRGRITGMFGSDTAVRPVPLDPAERLRPADVTRLDGPLYDEGLLRTLFLEFEHDDWFDELVAFYRTDVEVPARLIVDGVTYAGVGVRFRGSSSYLMVGSSLKRPFHLSVDYTDPKARLGGYKTLNLLNGNQDTSFVREVLFAHVARNYIPVPRVNYVKLVINGANWGVYQNAQQFNRDFLADAFDTKGGVRWKVLRNARGAGALTYRGDDPAAYRAYQLRTTNEHKPAKDQAAWQRLIHLCKVLDQTPTRELPAVLPAILNVDSVLWYCALENAFLPSDGYLNQGYDYRLYEDKAGRFHLISHDSNEILQPPQPDAVRSRALPIDASPLHNADDPQRPILHRLLAVPAWRARYLAHLRTVTERWLTWDALGPLCHGFHRLIGAEVAKDDKKLFSTRSFTRSLDLEHGSRRSLKSLVEERRQHILGHLSMRGPWPAITGCQHSLERGDGRRLRVVVSTGTAAAGAAPPTRVVLYYGLGKRPRYHSLVLHDDGAHRDGAAGDGVYGGVTPDLGVKGRVRFYVEARTDRLAAFHPAAAESGPLSDR